MKTISLSLSLSLCHCTHYRGIATILVCSTFAPLAESYNEKAMCGCARAILSTHCFMHSNSAAAESCFRLTGNAKNRSATDTVVPMPREQSALPVLISLPAFRETLIEELLIRTLALY